MSPSELEGLIGFLDQEEDEEEEKDAASFQSSSLPPQPPRSRFDSAAVTRKIIHPQLLQQQQPPGRRLASPYFASNWKDRDGEVYRFRLTSPASSALDAVFSAQPVISLDNLIHRALPAASTTAGLLNPMPKEFAVAAVLKHASSPKISATSQLPYLECTLTNLDRCECRLLVFGEAFKQYERAFRDGGDNNKRHPVLVLHSPGSLNANTLTVHFARQVIVCGESKDFALCRQCPLATNATVSRYCAAHAEEQMRVCAVNRASVSIVPKPLRSTYSSAGASAATASSSSNSVEHQQLRKLAAGHSKFHQSSTTKDAKTVIRDVGKKQTLSAGERMLMRAVNKTALPSSSASSSTPPALTDHVRRQVANPMQHHLQQQQQQLNKRTKLGSGLAGPRSNNNNNNNNPHAS